VLIFGEFGFPALGLRGSAWASVLQYAVMMVAVMCYILVNPHNRKYSIKLLSIFYDTNEIKRLISLSWPIIVDKTMLALAYIWLGKMICPLGKCAVASFCVIKDLERLAFVPAIAAAQVITFLASNDFGAKKWNDIKSNIKKVIFLASLMVFVILLIISIWSQAMVQIFDTEGDFTSFAATALPVISVLVFFDLLQLILSGALRGTGNVKTVMMVRFTVCLFYFVPVSYLIGYLPLHNHLLKFLLVYTSFYLGNGLMSIVYIRRFRSTRWQTPHKGNIV